MSASSLIPPPALELPTPIKPRKLRRLPDGTYLTSDYAYKITPRVVGSKLTIWEVNTDGRTSGVWRFVEELSNLRAVRQAYCAPGGVVPWLVGDMDEGLLRVESSRVAAVKWAESHMAAPVWKCHSSGTCYDYTFGADANDAEGPLFVLRADNAWRHGFDAEQQPMYPYPGHPHETGPRAAHH